MVEPPRRFVHEPLLEVIAHVRARLAAGASSVVLEVLDPDLGAGRHAGELVAHRGRPTVHRPWRAWIDLAERLELRLGTPRPVDDGFLRLELRPLDPTARWDAVPPDDPTEKYGPGSGFSRISKLEDPDFVLDLADALERAAPPPDARVLDLGVNTGDELALLTALRPELSERGRFVGVDHSASALAVARQRFPSPAVELVQADLGQLPRLSLGTFDLVLCMSTLQSPGVDDREVLRQIVQQLLRPDGAVIVGVPNCTYLDGELRYGAKTKNFRQPELSLAIQDVAYMRRYLQQHRKKVFVTGKYHLLVTAIPERPAKARP